MFLGIDSNSFRRKILNFLRIPLILYCFPRSSGASSLHHLRTVPTASVVQRLHLLTMAFQPLKGHVAVVVGGVGTIGVRERAMCAGA